MSIEARSAQYGTVFDHWQIRELLGTGSGGRSAVFRAVRSDSGRGACAVKVISLIEEQGRLTALNEQQKWRYDRVRRERTRAAEQEVWLMDELRGNTHIVDYLDHTTIDWSDASGFGRDLVIRMELLTDLRSELRRGRLFREEEILQIGRDICSALILCHRKNILHRDVKPENIFRNRDGNYKLGDFGISRVLEGSADEMARTGVGTFEYWPPEQMGGRYDRRVDIYSLGLVLYELSNRNRLPFAARSYVTGREVSRRLSGEPLPAPCDAGEELARIILTACAHDPGDRYQSAEEMLEDLDQLSSTTTLLSPLPRTAAPARRPAPAAPRAPAPVSRAAKPAGTRPGPKTGGKKRRRKRRAGDGLQYVLIALLLLCILCVGMILAGLMEGFL